MIAIPHSSCPECRRLIPLLRMESMFAPEDAPYLFIAPHDRRVRESGKNQNGYGAEEFYEVQCEGSMEEVPTTSSGEPAWADHRRRGGEG